MRSVFIGLVPIVIFSLFSISTQGQATFVQARHETLTQTQIDVTFNQSISFSGAPLTTGWSVTLNGNTALVTSVATNGPTVVTITIDATATTGHVAGQPFILQAETTTVRVSYSGTGNLTSTGGVTPFTNQLSANNFVFACSELAFFQQGIYPGATADICSPVNMNFFQFQFKLSLRFRNSTSYNIATMRYAINWGDAISTDAFPYQSDLAGASASTFVDGSIVASPTVVLTARPTHVYPATITPAPNICSWDLQLTPYYNGVATCFSLARTNIFATYDTDNANSGVLSMPAFTANSDRVCLGNNVSMQFTDNTLLNCRLGAPEAGVPNDLTRHIRIVYGSQDFDSPTLGGVINNIPDVRVTLPAILGGATTQITNNDATGSRILAAGYYPVGAGGIGFPDFNGVIQLPTPVNAATALAYMAQIFTVDPVTNHQVSQRFYVRLEYWDICNVYNSASPDANKVTVSNYVEIITKPVTPVATNKEYCFTETFASGGTCGAPTGEFFEVTAASVTGSTEIKWYNSLADANGDINGITSSYGTNCRFLRPENRTGGTGAMTAAAVYSVFVRYRTNSVAPNNCLSDATEVRITRRSSLSAPGAITPLTSDVCDATNNVPYSLASAAPVVAIGGATEYSWTFSGGTGATVDAPTTAQNITADFNLALAVPTATRNLNVVTQFTTNATTGGRCPTAASTRIVTIYGPTLGGTASGGASYCQGTDASDISLAGERGSVVRWEENFNSGGFFDAGVGSVTFFDPGVLAPGNYIYRAVVANGPCTQQNSTTTIIDVFPTPTTATAGIDQNLCQSLATPSAGLGGNVPIVGTGIWTQVSGPGVITFLPTTSTPNATATASAQGIYVVRWTISTGAGLCTSFENVQLDFGAPPAVPNAGADQDVCATTANLNGTVQTFETGTWSVTAFPVGGTVSFSDINLATATVSLSGAIVFGTYTLQWQFTSGTCTPEQDVVNITFRQAPTATAPIDFTACISNPPAETIPISGTFGGGATQARWERITGSGTFTSNGTTIGNFDNSNPATDVYTPTAADFTAGSVQLQLVTDDPVGACTAVSDPVTIIIDRRPANAIAGADVFTCDPNPTTSLAATAANNGGTGTWSVGNALYYETFTETNGLGLSGPNPHALTFTHPLNNWNITAPTTATLLASDDYLRVESNVMEAQDVNAELVWRSNAVTITAIPNITVSLQLAESGTMESGDYVRAFYRIDGGAEILIGQIVDDGTDGVFSTFNVSGLTGNTIEIVIRVLNDAALEFHRFDNVFVSGSGAVLPFITDVNNQATSITGIPVGATTFTWTVTSALGVCSSSMDQVIVTRHASPVNNPQTPALCEDVPTGGTATVTLAFLNSLNDAITGIAGSVGRTVQFFTDPSRAIPFPASASLANTDVVFTIVTRTDVTPNCQTDGTVTLTVNSRPAALNQSPEFCEDSPVGSNTRTGIDLTTFNNAVKNSVAANTVVWFPDATFTTPILGPTNVTANGTTSFFARVTNPTTTCTNDAQLNVTLNPIPSPNALIGPSNVCVSATAVNLYQLTVNNPGFTYAWTIPDPPFDRVIGGTATDFLVLLSFPVVVSPGQNIAVIETSDKGCVGQPNILNIEVESSPPAITILDPGSSPGPGTVCESEAGVIYNVANLANTTYAWTVPSGSSIIAGQGTFQITVNFGTTGGLISVLPTTTTGCAGNPDDYSVAINPRPTLTTSPNTVCSDTPASITLAGTGASTFNITNVSVPPGLSPASRPLINGALSSEIFNDVFTNTTGGNLTVQYTVVPVSAASCTGTAQIVNLTIRPEPVLAPNLNDAICSTTDFVGIVLSLASGSFPADQYEVFSVNNPAGLTPVAGNPTTLGVFTSGVLLDDKWQNLTGAAANIEYFIRPINSTTTCVGDPPIPVIVTVNPEPVIGALPPETICSGDSPATTITPSITGSTFNWTVVSVSGLITGNSSGSGPSGSSITDVLINNGAVSGSVTYSITATGPGGLGSCVGQAVNLVVNVDPSPTANSINQIVCSDTPGGNTFFIDLTTLQPTVNGGGGVTFSWFQDLALTTPIAVPTAHTLTSGVQVFVNVDNGQCAKVATILFTINPSPSVVANITSNYSGFQLSCNGASDGQITAVPANGTGPYLFSIDGGGSFFTTTVFNGLSVTGNPYTVRVRDSNGCIVDSAPLTIVPPTAVSAVAAITSSFNGEDVSCQAASNGVITVTPAGGAGTYTFRLLELPSNTTGDVNGIYTGLRAGDYTFVVKDANNCQFTTPTITVTEPTPVTATATLTSPVSCNGNSDGVITVVGGGGTLVGPTYTFTLIAPFTVNTTGIFSGLVAGNYTVNVEDDNGCVRTSNSVSVTQPSVLTAFASVTSNYNGAKISCPGADDGVITVTPNGGNGGYTFILVEDNTNISGDATGIYTGLAPGPYTVTVTDPIGCSVTTVAVSFSDPQTITPSFSITSAIVCNGDANGQITISANGGTGALTFTRISGSGSPVANGTGVFSGLAQGTYDFTVSDLNFCSEPIQVVLNEPAVVAASASVISNYNGAQINCPTSSDGVISITASGGSGMFNYTFNNPPLPNTTGDLSGIYIGVAAGTGYTFTVKDANAPTCLVVTAPINVNPPTPLVITSASVTSNYNGQDISCTGANDAIITVVVSGGTTIIPGPAGYTYVLNQDPLNISGNSSGVYTGVSPGSYTVTVRDANNCFVVTVPIVVDSYPVINTTASVLVPHLGGRQISCFGAADGEIQVTPTGGVGPYTYTIAGPTVNNTGDGSGASTIYTGLTAGSYTVSVFDQNSCPKTTATLTIVEPDELLASASVTSNYNGEEVKCFGSSDGIIKATVTGGTTAYTFVLNEMGGNATGLNSGIFTGVPANPSYTITVSDVNSCSVTTTAIPVTEPAALIISGSVTSNYNGEDISCNGANDAIIKVDFTVGTGTGTPTYAFDSYPAPGNVTGKFSGEFTSVRPNLVGYTITGTDVNGCTAQTAVIPVNEPAALGGFSDASSDYNGFDVSCFNLTDGEITVTATGGTGNPLADYSYVLLEASGNTSGSVDGTFDNLRAGTYRVRITDLNGCLFTTPVIPVIQPTDISIAIDVTSNYGSGSTDISCAGAADGVVSVRATIFGGAGLVGGGAGSGINDYSYELSDIGINDLLGDGVFTGLDNILYTVTATDANGCIKESLPVVLIEPIPLYEGYVGSSHDICINQDNPDPFTIITNVFGGNGSYLYQWQESISATGPFADIAGATNDTHQVPALPALTQTMHYRRIASTASSSVLCPSIPSNVLTITVNELPTATIENQAAVCQGSPFLLDFTFPDGVAPFTFTYNDGVNAPVNRIGGTVTPIFVPDYQQALTYTITSLVDGKGCIAIPPIASYTVPLIDVDADFTITSPNPQCSGSQFTFTYNADAGVEYNFQWPDGAFDVLTPGTGTINKILTSFNSDTNSDLPVVLTATHPLCAPLTTSKLITIFPSIVPNVVTNPTTMCSGSPISITNLTLGGDDHDWRIVRMSDGVEVQSLLDQPDPDSQSFTIDNDQAGALNPDVYEIRYTISNSVTNGGCTDQVIIPVRVYREVVASFTKPVPAVWNAMVGVNMVFTNTSTPVDTDFEYSWTFVSDATPNAFVGQNPPTINFSKPGLNKRVKLVASNPTALADPLLLNGCQSVDEYVFNIIIPPLAAGFVSTPAAACLPTTIVITSNTSTGDVHQWTVRNQSGVTIYTSGEVTPTFPITTPGQYTIDLITSSSLSAAVPVNAMPQIVQVYAYPIAVFEAQPRVLFVPDEQLRTFNSSVSPTDPLNSSLTYPIDYKWYFGDGTDTVYSETEPRHFYQNEGNYDVSLLAINNHGNGIVCIDTLIQRVQAKAQGFTRVPNAFTPGTSGPNGGIDNGSGLSRNDIFLPIMKGVKEFQMQIFDRWGNLVFESRETNRGWDGYDRNGVLLPAGVYVYKLVLRLANDQRATQIGDVTMIR